MYVQDVIAVVGHDSLTPYGATPIRCQAARNDVTAPSDHFDGQWERTQPLDQLALIRDADELGRGGGNIFSRVRAAPPPLIRQRARVASSAPSTYTPRSSTSFRSSTAIPPARSLSVEALELEIAARRACGAQ